MLREPRQDGFAFLGVERVRLRALRTGPIKPWERTGKPFAFRVQ
jgi:hypothetical protein